MRSSAIASVLLAAGVFATPVVDRRALVTHEVVVTVTDYVTIGDLPSTSSSSTTSVKPVNASPKAKVPVYVPHSHLHHPHPVVSTSVAPVPEPVTTSPEAVAPSPTSTTKQAYIPPVETTYTSVAAPKTTTAPVESSAAASNNDLPKTVVAGLTSEDPIYHGLTLLHHNVHRTNHSAAALEWNQTLADFAKTTAQTCVWQHDLTPGGGGYGQNIAAGTQAGDIASILSNGFYNGEEPHYPSDYGNNNPDMSDFEKWGHFSQMVWANTESVGCYTHTCTPPGVSVLDCKPDGTPYLANTTCKQMGAIPEAQIFTVCNYYPAGNYAGEYSNVKAPKGSPTVAMTDSGVVGL